MSPDPRVLDSNLERLLRRAYVPALPRPELRRAALAAARDEARRRARAARPRRLALPLAAAAAALAAAALLLVWLGRGGAHEAPGGPAASAAALVARGEVAVRSAEGVWRAASAAERAHGVALADAAELATPAEAGAALVAAAARADVGPGSRVALDARTPGLALEAGAARLALAEGAPAWSVGAADVAARVRVDAGSAVEIEREGGSLHVRLVLGAATLRSARGERALAPGETVDLGADDLVAAERAGSRRAVAPAAPAEPEPAEPALAGAAFALAVRGPDGAPVERFRAIVLPLREVPDVASPRIRDVEAPGGLYAWDGLEPDAYEVRIEAEGFAQHKSERIDLAADQRIDLAIQLERGATVRGFVVDDATSAPLAGATVVVETEVPAQFLPFDLEERPAWLRRTARTGPDGWFTLEHVRTGLARLRVDAPGLAPSWASVEVAAGRASEVALVRLAAGGSVEGVITDDRGRPVEGAVVLATFADDPRAARLFSYRECASDAEGRYAIHALPAGFHMLVMFPSRAAMERDTMPVLRPAMIAVGRTARVDFRADVERIALSGRVLDAGGEPVGNLKLTFLPVEANDAASSDDWTATATDGAGAFALELDRAGPHLVYATIGMGEKLTCVARVDVPAGVAAVERDVVLGATRLGARIVRADDRSPVEHATAILLSIDDDGGSSFAGTCLADAEGRAVFDGLLPGRYRVVAAPEVDDLGQAVSEVVEVAAPSGSADVEIALPLGGRLRVRVLDAAATPLAGAGVQVHAAAGGVIETGFDLVTDAQGEVEVPGLAPGVYRVDVERAGLAPASRIVEVRAVIGAEITVTLEGS